MAKYQLQLLTAAKGPTGLPEWRDINTQCGVPGPADKATATAALDFMCSVFPDETYRVVKLVKEK